MLLSSIPFKYITSVFYNDPFHFNRCHSLANNTSRILVKRVIFPRSRRKDAVRHTYQRALPWDFPKLVFPKPENLFPRPERLIEYQTIREFIQSQGEAVKKFPWAYIIFAAIFLLTCAEIVIRAFGDKSEDEEMPETGDTLEERPKDRQKPVPMTKEQATIFAMKKNEFQAKQNGDLLVIGIATLIALWLAGFLNTPHPFTP